MVEMGSFLNEFAGKLHVFLPLVVFAVLGLPAFGIWFNNIIDKLDLEDGEHTSIYVAIGNGVTLIVLALFSWKAALVAFILFGLDGLPMIFGDYQRTKRQKLERTMRIKRLPYKANGIIDEAQMAADDARRMLNSAFKTKDEVERAIKLAGVSNEINIFKEKMYELKLIQRGEG